MTLPNLRPRAAAAAAVICLLATTACAATVTGRARTERDGAASRARSSAPSRSVPSGSAPNRAGDGTTGAAARHRPPRPVHAGLFETDGGTYGVGMPIVVRFTRPVTDVRPFERAVRVDVGGRPAAGAWAWAVSPAPGWAVEAHYRLRHFWPAHSHISLDAPLKGLSAGAGLAYDDDLTLSMNIGARHISVVDDNPTRPRMTVTSDGHVVRVLPASLGTDLNRTLRGTKIVEEFDRTENMDGTPVAWSVRMTNSGEFVHAAPWNGEIGRANLSHGCTNLSTADARWFYRFSRLGDVVRYPNAPGPVVPATDGFGDWNVPWAQWRAGGML